MTPAAVDGEWAATRFWVSNSAGLARVRTDALTQVLRACGVATSVFSRLGQATGLSLYGRRPLVAYFDDQLDELVAEMDAAALAATRRYGAGYSGSAASPVPATSSWSRRLRDGERQRVRQWPRSVRPWPRSTTAIRSLARLLHTVTFRSPALLRA